MTTAADWSSRVGDVWAEEWRRTDRSLAALDGYLDQAVRAVAPERGRFLDIGCGAGATTLALSRARPAANVLGVDLSPSLIEIARTRLSLDWLSLLQARAAPDVFSWPERGQPDLAVGDAVALAASRGPSDLMVSRHGVMFFDDPVGAFTALGDAASAGAPLIFTCFGPRQANRVATLAEELGGPAAAPTDRPGPFAFADEALVAAILRLAGWFAPVAVSIDFAYRVGEGDDAIADAIGFLSRVGPVASALRDVPEARSRLGALLAPYRADAAIDLPGRAWLWHATAGEQP